MFRLVTVNNIYIYIQCSCSRNKSTIRLSWVELIQASDRPYITKNDINIWMDYIWLFVCLQMVEFWVFRVQSHFKMPSLGWNSMQTTFRKIRQKQPWFIIPSPYNWLDGSFMKNYICSSAWNNPTVGKVEHRTKNFIDKTGRLNERVPSRLPNRSYFYAHNGQTIAAICPFHRFGFVYDNHKIRSKWKSARYFFSRSLRFNFFDKQVKSRRKQIKQLNCAMEQRETEPMEIQLEPMTTMSKLFKCSWRFEFSGSIMRKVEKRKTRTQRNAEKD